MANKGTKKTDGKANGKPATTLIKDAKAVQMIRPYTKEQQVGKKQQQAPKGGRR